MPDGERWREWESARHTGNREIGKHFGCTLASTLDKGWLLVCDDVAVYCSPVETYKRS